MKDINVIACAVIVFACVRNTLEVLNGLNGFANKTLNIAFFHSSLYTDTIDEPTNSSAPIRTNAANPPNRTSLTTNTRAPTTAADDPSEPKRSPVAGAAAVRAMLPIDLNAELKSRLKKSTHASVGNLKKSCTVNMAAVDQTHASPAALSTSASMSHLDVGVASPSSGSSASPTDTEDSCDPTGKDLGKLLRRLPIREPKGAESAEAESKPPLAASDDGESSGGLEVKTIIKSSAVTRNKKFKDG